MSDFAARLDAILVDPVTNVTDLIAWSREAQAKLAPKVYKDRKAYMREYMRRRRAKPEAA